MIIALLEVGLLAGLTWSPALRAELRRSLQRQPTPYTELSFGDHLRLPKAVELSRPIVFSFDLVNRQGAAQAYPYVVTTTTTSASEVIDRGTVRVGAGARATRSVVFVPQRRAGYVIAVRLLHRPEAIHFFTEVG